MSNRFDIMDQIKNDITSHIKASLGYNYTPIEVRRGRYNWSDFNEYPSLSFSLYREHPDDSMEGGEDVHWVYIEFRGHHKNDGYNTDYIYNLLDDLESFLQSDDFTYSQYIHIDDILIKEGSISDSVNSFSMLTKIAYSI